jgi:DNA-directed RNA polymerase sigma subunit (sigma70/sigma32)
MGDDPWFSDSVYSDDPVSVYLAEARQIPSLSRDEEIDCIRHVRAGDQQAAAAGKRLMEANLLLVLSIAERYRSASVPLLDLIQQGNEGLMLAIRTLHENSDDGFSAHVTCHIERAIAKIVGPSDSGLNQTGH